MGNKKERKNPWGQPEDPEEKGSAVKKVIRIIGLSLVIGGVIGCAFWTIVRVYYPELGDAIGFLSGDEEELESWLLQQFDQVLFSDEEEGIAETTPEEEVDTEEKAVTTEIGMQFKEITTHMVEAYGMPAGVLVYDVRQNTVAAQEGILSQDVITAVNEVAVYGVDALTQAFSSCENGEEISLTILRWENGSYQEYTFRLTIG